MASAKRDDWDEKTVFNQEPAEQFFAEQSGERRSLPDAFEMNDLEVTQVREVPSSVLRAAADPDGTLEMKAGPIPDIPPSVREPGAAQTVTVRPPAPLSGPEPSRDGSAVGIVLAFAFLALVVTALVILATR